jgi:hypothetical protein
MTLEAEEFIRRFLFHVLPEGFQRIRYYGFLANRYREEKLARCRELLDMLAPEPPALEDAKDYRERYQEIVGRSLWECPACHLLSADIVIAHWTAHEPSRRFRTLTVCNPFRSSPEIRPAFNTHRSRSGQRFCPIHF